MNFAFTLTLLVSLLIAEVYCNHEREHENNHHNNHGDNKWITFVSQIESFWKTETPVKSSETITESSFDNKEVHSFDTTDDFGFHRPDDTFVITDVRTRYEEPNWAVIISIPIVGIIVLICGCYWICRCFCGACGKKQQGHVIVMNSNVVQPSLPQPTQVTIQQPVYNHMSPPQPIVYQHPPPPQQYGQQQFQQQGQPQFQQHEQPQFQQHGYPQYQQQMPPPQYYEYPDGGIENPNFYHASAPPESPAKY